VSGKEPFEEGWIFKKKAKPASSERQLHTMGLYIPALSHNGMPGIPTPQVGRSDALRGGKPSATNVGAEKASSPGELSGSISPSCQEKIARFIRVNLQSLPMPDI